MVLSMKVYGQASPAVIYSAGYGKVIPQFGLRFNDNKTLISGSADPSAVATDAPIGSIYISSNGLTYQKQDNGSSTNWTRLYFVPVFTDDNRLVKTDGTDNVQQSGITVSDLDAVTGVASLAVDNLLLDGNTVSSTNANGDINLSPNGFGGVVIDGLRVDNYVLSSTGLNQAIELNPNGTGTVDVPYLSNGGIVFGGSNGALIEDIANFSYSSIDERLSVNNATIGNIGVSANTISSTNTNGDIILNPNGTGDVLVDTLTNRRVVFNDNKALTDDSQFTYDSATKKLRVDGLDLGGVNTITTHSGNNDLILTAHGTGEIQLQKPTLIDDLKVTGQEIAGQVVDGDIDITANGIGEINLNNAVNIGDLQIDNDAITNTVLNGNIALVPNGTGNLNVKYGTNELNLDPQNSRSILENGSFERGVQGTCTDCTLAVSTTVKETGVLNNNQSLAITITAANSIYELPLNTTDIEAGAGYSYQLRIKTAVSSVEVCEEINGVVRNCQEVPSDNKWKSITFYGQIGSTSTSIIVQGGAATSGVIYLDLVEAVLGKAPTANVPTITDWREYTPALTGFGTPTNVQFHWRRVGSSLEVRGRFASGTPTAVQARLSLPSDFKISSEVVLVEVLGSVTRAAGASGYLKDIVALGVSDNDYITFGPREDQNPSDPLTSMLATSFIGVSQTLVVNFSVPIEGWGGSVPTMFAGQAGGALLVVTNESVTSNVTIGNATITVPFANVKESNLISWASNEATFQASGRYSLSANVSTVNTSDAATLKYTLEIDSGSGYAATDYQISSFMSTGQRMTPNIEFVFDANKGNKARLRVGSNSGGSIISQSAALTSSMTIRSVLDTQTVAAELEGVVKVHGEPNSTFSTGWASFGGATVNSICGSSPCTRHNPVGEIGRGMTLAYSGLSSYTLTTTGWKSGASVLCTVGCRASESRTCTTYLSPSGGSIVANTSGVATLTIVTRDLNASAVSISANATMAIKCTGEIN
jgi:hypothetical protein